MALAFISPCFHDELYGGVQYSARLAFEGMPEMKRLCYGPLCQRKSQTCSHSKSGAILGALRVRGGNDRLLFWHLDLLKLLPFIGARGKRIFLFLHGIECWRAIGGSTRRLLERVDVFLTNSDFTWKRFVEMNPQCGGSEHRTVLLGVGTPDAQIEDPGDTPAAAIVARMHQGEGYKGHAELIQAWPLVLEKIPAAELWVIGGGDGIDGLKALALTAGVDAQIRFFGVVSEEEKQRLLRQSRCLVLPSRGEGFGLVYLEAMRAGRPCLSSIQDAGKEVIHPPEAGVAVDPADTAGVAAAVVELLTPGAEWRQRSANARRRYEENFTAAHFQARLASAIEGIAA